jgi:hypothetical protein
VAENQALLFNDAAENQAMVPFTKLVSHWVFDTQKNAKFYTTTSTMRDLWQQIRLLH